MTTRIAFFYLMKNEPDRIATVAPLHHRYWMRQEANKYVGGPFADLSGGLITFEAESIEHARSVIEHDPFVLEEVLDNYWIKEWITEPGKPDE